MAKEPTQKAKLTLKALDLTLTQDIKNDYYLQPKLQKSLTLDDIARETAALSTRQEDAEELARTCRDMMRRMTWYLSSGYSITTPLGSFRVTAGGVLLESELTQAPPRDRLRLGVSYTMSPEMRQALAEAEIDVEIQRTATGPQLYAVVSAHDAQHPGAATRGEGVPVTPGQTCIIRGRNIKVGGTGAEIGVTLTRTDGAAGAAAEKHFFPLAALYPNTASQVGFVLPADAPQGSVWSVRLCTQLGNGNNLLKAARTSEMPVTFVVGEVNPDVPSGGGGEGGGEAPDPQEPDGGGGETPDPAL